jgi:ribosomal protein S18 acetylase RimI-like enzyme
MSSSTDDIIYRVAEVGDIRGICLVQERTWLSTYVNETEGITEEDILKKDFGSPERIAGWKSILNDGEGKFFVYIAGNSEGSVVGFCAFAKGDARNCLQAVYVLQEYQGKGIGGRLISIALRALGRDKDIVLDVVSYNGHAIAFYERLGFKKIGDTPISELAMLPSGRLMPEIRMILEVGARTILTTDEHR